MLEILPIVTIALLLVVIVLLITLLFRKPSVDLSPLQQALQATDKVGERAEQTVRDEIAKNRAESSMAAKESREELNSTLKALADTFNKDFSGLTQASFANAKTAREETAASLQRLTETLVNSLGEIAKLQKGQLDVFSERLEKLTLSNEQKFDKMRESIEQRLGIHQEESGKKLVEMRQEATTGIQKSREEVTTALKTYNESVGKTINDFVTSQHRQLCGVLDQVKTLTNSNEKRLDTVCKTLEEKLKAIQDDNMRGQLRETIGTLDEAIEDDTAAIKCAPSLQTGVWSLLAKARASGDDDRLRQAIEAYEEGQNLSNLGQYPKAMKYYQRAINICPTFPGRSTTWRGFWQPAQALPARWTAGSGVRQEGGVIGQRERLEFFGYVGSRLCRIWRVFPGGQGDAARPENRTRAGGKQNRLQSAAVSSRPKMGCHGFRWTM